MSFKVNKVLIGGNLTRDPELRVLDNGTALVKFCVAINESWGTGEDRKEKTIFVNVTAFGRTGEAIEKYLSKGDPILITDAKLDFSEWTDKTTGTKRSALSVKCEAFQFVGGKRDDAPNETQSDEVPF